MSEETVEIAVDVYDSLLKDSIFLEKLRYLGVDNWDLYGDAFKSWEELEELY